MPMATKTTMNPTIKMASKASFVKNSKVPILKEYNVILTAILFSLWVK